MIPAPLSAVDCVSPAIEFTKYRFRTPGRWSKWWRVGFLGLVIGEFGGCSGGNIGDLARIGQETSKNEFQRTPPFGLDTATWFAIIAVLIVGIFALTLLHLYLASVLRFIYWDAAATGRYRIREGWRMWRERGARLFVFFLLLMLAMLVVLGVLASPIIYLAATGALKGSGGPGAMGILLIMLAVLVFLFMALVAALFFVLVKDFAVPIMALEGLRPGAAIRKAWQMVKADVGNYAGYVGMKIVLSIAYYIGTGIVQFILLLILIIPLVIAGVGAGVAWPELFKNAMTIAFLITALVIFIFAFSFAMAVLFAPLMFFFQVYANLFFGSRYLPLWNLMYPPPPPVPAAPQIPPDTPPVLSPA